MGRKITYAFIFLLLATTIFFIRAHHSVVAQSQCGNKNQGDANCDSNIDENDYIIWRCEFLGGNNCQGNFVLASADFNEDSETDMLDYEIWRSNRYTAPTVTQAVPTPTTGTTAKPDLEIGSMTNFCITYDGEDTLTVHYDFTVRNSGAVASPANASEFIFSNPNFGITSDINSFNLPAIEPNQTAQINGQKNLNCPLCAALTDPSVGVDLVLGMVLALDRNETIDEENELNNAPSYIGELCSTVTPTLQPTLTPTSIILFTVTPSESPL